MESKDFDERQKLTHGKVYARGFSVAMILLLINAWLQHWDIVWASGLIQNMSIMILAGTVVAVELIWCGAYVKVGESRWWALVFYGFFALGGAIVLTLGILRGIVLVENRMLTEKGALFIFLMLWGVIGAIGIIAEMREKLSKT